MFSNDISRLGLMLGHFRFSDLKFINDENVRYRRQSGLCFTFPQMSANDPKRSFEGLRNRETSKVQNLIRESSTAERIIFTFRFY